MTEYLVDLASYQHGANLAALRPAGYTKVNIKLTQGTSYVDPYIGEFVTGARADNLDISTFHWLDGRSSGAAQAAYCQAQMTKWGLRYGTAHQCDCEDTTYPATWAIWRDYINAMQDWLGRPVANYTGDWWWGPHMGGNNGAAVTPYLWAAPDHGYDLAYPGDSSPDWHANFGGYVDFAALQFAVGPLPGVGGNDPNLSKTAFRDPHVWTALTGVDAASTGGNTMGAYEFEISDKPGAQFLGVRGGGFYALRDRNDYEGDNLEPHTPVGPYTYEQAKRIFGPDLTPLWDLASLKGAPGKDGVDGKDGAPGVVEVGTKLTVTVAEVPPAQ